MGFLGKMWTLIRGFFIRAGDDMVSGSPEAIKAAYAAAITDAQKRYTELESAVALLARERERTEERMKASTREEEDLVRKLEGALAAAEADPDNQVHREAGIRYQTRIQELDEQQAKLSQDLDVQRKKVDDYKTKLRSFRSEIDKLKREQGEMVADFVGAQQMLILERKLQGMGETSSDQSLAAIREKVGNMNAQAKIAGEMNASGVANQDRAYEDIGAQTVAANKFDELLKSRQAAKEGAKTKARDLG